MITVLGATGNVGSKIASQLLALKQPVRVVGRDAKKLAAQFKGAEVAAGDIFDPNFLTEALKGSTAAFVMIPPDYTAVSMGEHYKKASQSIATAIQNSKIQHVVNLSSLGAQHADGTGPIKHLHSHEQRLNRLENVNVLHLRPTYFFENLLMNLPLIQSQSIMGSHINGDVRFSLIATVDIASAAVKALTLPVFKGKTVQELLGPKDFSMDEAAAVVSEVVGKPVKYIAFDAPSTQAALTGMGLSADVAGLFVEMSHAINTGLIKGKRDSANTTSTKFEQFAQAFKVG